MRWQEVFGGADAGLLRRSASQSAPTRLVRPNRQARFPYLWGTVAAQGQLYGNRARAVNVTNHKHFSCPGYQEVLNGFADPAIRTNAPVNNPHRSVLSIINAPPRLSGAGGRVRFLGGAGRHS